MSSQVFLWINAGLAVGILMLFVVRRGQRQPTRLKLRAPRTSAPSPQSRKEVMTLDPETQRAQSLHGKEKNLNVLFIYNGHSWDAYEVLGLPAGASPKMVEEAYKREKVRVESSKQDFIETAYQAIQIHRKGA